MRCLVLIISVSRPAHLELRMLVALRMVGSVLSVEVWLDLISLMLVLRAWTLCISGLILDLRLQLTEVLKILRLIRMSLAALSWWDLVHWTSLVPHIGSSHVIVLMMVVGDLLMSVLWVLRLNRLGISTWLLILGLLVSLILEDMTVHRSFKSLGLLLMLGLLLSGSVVLVVLP